MTNRMRIGGVPEHFNLPRKLAIADNAFSGTGLGVESSLVWGIHVAAGGPVTTVEEGQRVAISRFGSGSHLIAVVDSMMRGFDPKTMEFVVVDNIDGARTALAEGRADIFLWERHMTQPLVDSGEFRRIGEREVPWPAFVISARNDFLDTNADALRRALAIVATYCQILRDGDGSAQFVSEACDIAPADAERWLP